MAGLQLGVPITIGDEEVIICRDAVGAGSITTGREDEVFTIIEMVGTDGRPPIWIDEGELSRLRENFPGINVYGLWQLLFANNLVPLGHEVVLFPTSESGGEYLQMQRGADYYNPANIRRTSEFADGFSADLYAYDLGSVPRIHVPIEGLKLPSSPAFTRLELYAKKQHENTKRWYLTGSICLVISVLFGAYNYTMQSVYRMKMAEYATKKQLTVDLDARTGSLLKERLPERPNDEKIISIIDEILAYDSGVTTPTEASHRNGFGTGHIFLTSENFSVDLSGKIPGVTSLLTPNMSYLLTVAPDAGEVSH